ncbi:MAG: glycosyltransferase family 1 protein [Bacillota bacterium]|nr:glycosyltransferase family 1 protein [Bacillota bacterium]
MIRVLHSVSNMHRAGIETMLMNYYRRMDRSRIQFDFLCNKPDYGAYEPEIEELGGHIYRAPGLNPLKIFKYGRFMKNLIEKNPDIRILHAHNESMAAYALISARHCGVPIRIFHSHNTRTERDYKWPLKMVCKQLLPFGYTKRFACGEAAARYFFGKKPAYILHNAIEIDKFAFSEEKRNKIREEYNLTDSFVIGHVGRFNYQKNHAFLIDVFAGVIKECPNARLVLIGNGELEEKIKIQAGKLGIEDKILFPGSIANVDQWYSAMDVFALPSRYEGLPVVGVEAQASGVKCLFSDKISDEVQVTETTEMIPLNKNIWIKKIVDCAGCPRCFGAEQEIRDAGYDIDIEADKLSEYYLSLIKTL